MTINELPQASVYYSINATELERLVGDNKWAGWALRRDFVKIADIPQDERETYESYWDDLRSKIKIDLFDEETKELGIFMILQKKIGRKTALLCYCPVGQR